MILVNSFDIFDTLLARKVKNPTDIFDIIEIKYPYNNFKNLRIQAQNNSNQTIENIYYIFKLLTGETDENIKLLREFELKIEMENTIPIMSNILKIKNNDILVSDMYLSHKELRKLLDYHNINPNTTLYVSPHGKSQGYMWSELIKIYKINNHIGDNYHSDIIMASNFKINTTYTKIHNFSYLENYLININSDLCSFFRTFRLINPYDENTLEYKIYDQQAQYNIPLLLFMCKKIENILTNENRNKVLFLSRDGCLIYKLFSFIYPKFNSDYLYSSRFINKNYNDDYISYLKNIYDDKNNILLFDLHGSFKSGKKLYKYLFDDLPRIFIFDLSYKNEYYDKITYITNISDKIEFFNLDINGSLIDFKNNKPIFLPNEIPLKYIKIIHNTIENFIKYMDNYNLKLDETIFNNDLFWVNYYTYIAENIENYFII